MGRNNTPADVFRYIDTHGNDTSVCWEWTGSTGGRDGRGTISIDGKKYQAHRVVFELFNGEIADGMVVRHRCDNPICCNPTHLVIGTKSMNTLDMYERDRMGYSHDMLREMRRLALLGMMYKDIAAEINKKFKTNISISGVGKVLRGERRASG